jgi:hypothetical protein
MNERVTVSMTASTDDDGKPASHATPTVGKSAVPRSAAATASSLGDQQLGWSIFESIDGTDAQLSMIGDHIVMSTSPTRAIHSPCQKRPSLGSLP